MNALWLAVGGMLGGLAFGVWLVRLLLIMPTTRIFIADWFNWSPAQLPNHLTQVIRHGRWVADEIDEDTP